MCTRHDNRFNPSNLLTVRRLSLSNVREQEVWAEPVVARLRPVTSRFPLLGCLQTANRVESNRGLTVQFSFTYSDCRLIRLVSITLRPCVLTYTISCLPHHELLDVLTSLRCVHIRIGYTTVIRNIFAEPFARWQFYQTQICLELLKLVKLI